jgi:Predicted transcriptional regulator
MSEEAKPTELLPLVTDIVAAHLSNNNVPSAELPQLIRDVYHALAAASGGGPAPLARPEAAVPVKKSVTPDTSSAWRTARS